VRRHFVLRLLLIFSFLFLVNFMLFSQNKAVDSGTKPLASHDQAAAFEDTPGHKVASEFPAELKEEKKKQSQIIYDSLDQQAKADQKLKDAKNLEKLAEKLKDSSVEKKTTEVIGGTNIEKPSAGADAQPANHLNPQPAAKDTAQKNSKIDKSDRKSSGNSTVAALSDSPAAGTKAAASRKESTKDDKILDLDDESTELELGLKSELPAISIKEKSTPLEAATVPDNPKKALAGDLKDLKDLGNSPLFDAQQEELTFVGLPQLGEQKKGSVADAIESENAVNQKKQEGKTRPPKKDAGKDGALADAGLLESAGEDKPAAKAAKAKAKSKKPPVIAPPSVQEAGQAHLSNDGADWIEPDGMPTTNPDDFSPPSVRQAFPNDFPPSKTQIKGPFSQQIDNPNALQDGSGDDSTLDTDEYDSEETEAFE
ncbi:hypothetical protein HDU91_000322, partial [Kappamyces sp. JEL0680]